MSKDFLIALGALAAFFVALRGGLWGFAHYRLRRFQANLRKELAEQGYSVSAFELRWWTRGPFRDMPIPGIARNSRDYLLRVFAENRARRPCRGWVRWRVPFPWNTAERWLLAWDDTVAVKEGASSPVFFTVMLVFAVVVVTSAVLVLFRLF